MYIEIALHHKSISFVVVICLGFDHLSGGNLHWTQAK
jgi:hypothetical protein